MQLLGHKQRGNKKNKKKKQCQEMARLPEGMPQSLKQVIVGTPEFNFYKVQNREHVLSHTVRPANLFYAGLGLDAVKPGEGFFEIRDSVASFQECIHDVEVKCANIPGKTGKEAAKIFGKGKYYLSQAEIESIVESHKVHLTNNIPKDFYVGLKEAMNTDGVVILPTGPRGCLRIQDSEKDERLPTMAMFLRKVRKNPSDYGFDDCGFGYEDFRELTLYQVGSMVVKTEKYHCFVDDKFQIENRSVGTVDDILLISTCGIRWFHKMPNTGVNLDHKADIQIMTEAYRTSMLSVGNDGMYILPALGMGVWEGSPTVYWTAFLNAVLLLDIDLLIFVAQGHQKIRRRVVRGEDFQDYLSRWIEANPDNENLKKIVNLYPQRTDLLHLAKHLKKAFPMYQVGLQNASDPDVTLGNHVGQRVNTICRNHTTEENFTALGTNGINFERYSGVLNKPSRIFSQEDLKLPDWISEDIRRVISNTPKFNFYKVQNKASVLSHEIRPANLFYAALGLDVVKPGEGNFAIRDSYDSFHECVKDVEIKCDNISGSKGKVAAEIFGRGIYRLSKAEIEGILESQTIYLSRNIPKAFYLGLKEAMNKDKMVAIPSWTVKALEETELLMSKYLKKVAKNPSAYGFNGSGFTYADFRELTLAQVGAMVVKVEKYYCFVDDDFQIEDREVGSMDDILLINACGIRGAARLPKSHVNIDHKADSQIMTQTYKASMLAVGDNGMYILPALGMGAWRGSPKVYWTAFLNAVLLLDIKIQIFVSPGHQRSHATGESGEEFQLYLTRWITNNPENENLRNIINLFRQRTDVLHLAKHLKRAFPMVEVGLQNASNPDVTLGNHVGEGVNHIVSSHTAEENFTALGTNGINFERYSGVLGKSTHVVYVE